MSRRAIWFVALAFVAVSGLIAWHKSSSVVLSPLAARRLALTGDLARAVDAVQDSLDNPDNFELISVDAGGKLTAPGGKANGDGRLYFVQFRQRNEFGGWTKGKRVVQIWPNEPMPIVMPD